MSITHRLRIVISLLFGVVFIGTLGFEFIEGWSLLDSFYMTLVTISTVGYQEIHPLSQAGRAFTAGLIIVGVGATLYGLTVIFELLVEGQIRGLLGKRRMERGLRRMKDHFVVCGYGRVGRRVVAELRRRGKKVVVIESRPECQERLSEDKMHFISGDATDDKVLEASGIKTARGLILALPNQAANVLITLSARHCNPHIRIVGRADEDQIEEKLRLAGADAVVCPHEIGGLRMAIASVSPNVLDFMQIAGGDEKSGIRIDEILIAEGASICGLTLRESPIRAKLGLMVVALRKSGGDMRFNPDASERLEVDDVLIVIGPSDKLGTLRELTATPEKK